jgi:ArsR family transcriptional regulator
MTTRGRGRIKVKKRTPRSRENEGAGERAEIEAFDPKAVRAALSAIPEEEVLEELSDNLKGLAHPSRLKAVFALSAHELCVGDIAAILGLSLSATSTLLKVLRNAGHVKSRSAGKQTYYRLRDDLPMALIAKALAPRSRSRG